MEEIASFDDNEVVELDQAPEGGAISQEEIKADPTKDTFDNNVYPETKKDSQVQLLDEEDDKDESQTPEKDGKKEESEDDTKSKDKEEESSEEEKTDEEKPEEKPSGKSIRVKDGDKAVDISPEATVKVKVKGKNEFVSIEELKSNYSGQKAWSEEIEAAKEKTSTAEAMTEKLTTEKQEIIGHLEKVAGMMDREDGDPLEALYYLLDITGRDVNTYSKRVFDFMESQVDGMSEMDETEKELYWNRKKLSMIENNQAAKAEELKQENAQRALIARVNQLRESQGVSEDQYVEAHKELVGLGLNSEEIRPEQVVEYASIKPFAERAEAITYEYRDELGDDDLDSLTTEIAGIMRKRPTISNEDALTISLKTLGYEFETVDDQIDQLNDKIQDEDTSPSSSKKYKGSSDSSHIESFDDYETY